MTEECQASLSFTISQSLLKLMSIESVMLSNHLILCHPLLFLLSIFPSFSIFSNKSALLIRRPKYWSFSFSISPSNEYLRFISFRIDWFDLLAVQGTLKSLLQHSSKASILQRSALFMVQLSHPYMTTGKTIALTIWTIKKAEHLRIDTFELWCWRRLLRVPWTARRSNRSILKEINLEYSLEGLMLKLKLQYSGHLMRKVDSLEKTLMLGKTEGKRRKGVTEDEMLEWHH